MPTKHERERCKQVQREAATRRRIARVDGKRARERSEALLRQKLVEPRGRMWLIEQIKAAHPRTCDGRFDDLCAQLDEIAPRLLIADYMNALFAIARLPWLRPLDDWRPRGKARIVLFRSLCEHLFARYPMPAFLWSAFTERNADKLTPVALAVARGGSLYKLSASAELAVPLTRRQCHEVLQAHAQSSVLHAIRRVQVASVGGSDRLLSAWIVTPPGARIGTRGDEEFWLDALRLVARTPQFDLTQLMPLVDYIRQRRQEPRFSMKGRSVAALLRGMHEWHRELHRARVHERYPLPERFVPSGIRGADYDHSARDRRSGELRKCLYQFREILTAEALRLEGKAQHHCVYSYGGAIAAGITSIWSLTVNRGIGPERLLTIEISNADRSIVQVRGFANRLATNEEHRLLARWAADRDLVLRST